MRNCILHKTYLHKCTILQWNVGLSTVFDILFEYAFALRESWWAFAIGACVGVLKAYEWLFREGRAVPVPSKWRYTVAALALVIAQFQAYRSLRLRSHSEMTRQQAELLRWSKRALRSPGF